MTEDEFNELTYDIGFCGCNSADLLPLLKELLEIGAQRELDEEIDDAARDWELWLADTQMRAAAHDWRLRQWVLGIMSARDLIAHEHDELDSYVLTPLGGEALDYLRALDDEDDARVKAEAN